MNALAILQHAYQSISTAHPEKDAFQIVADVESIAERIAKAALALETALGVKVAAETPQG